MNLDSSPSSQPIQPSAESTGSRFRLRSTLLGSGLLLLGLGWGLASLDRNSPNPAPQTDSPRTLTTSPTEPSPSPEAPGNPPQEPAPRFRPEQMEGEWVRNGSILRHITILPGGKAKLTVQLDYFSALIYGREMQMDLSWELDDDILTHTIVSGTPKANVDRLIRDFGDSLSYRVVKVDATELVLEDLDDGMEQHHWKAVHPPSASVMKPSR